MVVGLIAAVVVSGQCDLLALEDKTARSIGVSVAKSRMVISVIAVLLAAISTAVIGAISFLGLIVPHIARLLVGSSHKNARAVFSSAWCGRTASCGYSRKNDYRTV